MAATVINTYAFPAAAMSHPPLHSQSIIKLRAPFLNPVLCPQLPLDPTLENASRSSVCAELSLTSGSWSRKLPSSSSRLSSFVVPSASPAVDTAVSLEDAAEMQKQKQKQKQPSSHVWRDVEVGSKWRDIQGENEWEGLLGQPLDETLRAELIRYGEFAQITYDAFDFDPHSIYCGSCKYSRKTLFRNVGKGDCGYEVKKYLYATSNIELPKFFKKSDRAEEHRWSGDSNWMGYIAVSTDEDEIKRLGRRDIMIAWRGTIMKTEWIDDLMDLQVIADFEPNQNKVRVEAGFRSLYTSKKPESKFNKLNVRDQMLLELKRILKKYEGEELSITITGHSLGAALALLSAYDIAATVAAKSTSVNGKSPPKLVPAVTVFSFSGPRVGNLAFKERVEGLGVKVLRVVNEHDKVPTVPGVFMNEKGWWAAVEANAGEWLRSLMDGMEWAYYHVGKELRVDLDVSPHLARSRDLANHHNLEAHLHVLDGFQGIGPFQSVFKRNPALVNKSSAFLVREAYIPPSWWQDQNKGLVQNERGEWVLANREEEHLPENHHP